VPSVIRFGTDGWRATIAETYTFDNVRIASQATAEYFRTARLAERGIVVGYDTRFGSDRFARAVAEVLAGNGVRVLLSDRFQPTPVLSHSVLDRKAGGAIIITASHNPAPDNGFKVKTDAGSSAPPEVVAEIEAVIEKQPDVKRMPLDDACRQGLVEEFDARPAYEAQVARLLDLDKLRQAGITVVADSMFGTGIGYFKGLLDGGSTRVVEVHNHVNPAFPGLRPEPIPPNTDELSQVVREAGADAGLATDGDSDRIGAVDENGRFVTQHQVFGLLLLYLTEQRALRGPAVRSVTMTSQADAYMRSLGEEMIETPVGFKYIGNTMVERDALLGGEESGGFGFRGHIPERDGIVSGLFLLDLMVRLGRPMSGALAYLRERFGQWDYSRIDLTFASSERQAIYQRVGAANPSRLDGSPVARVRELETRDGYKLYAEDGSWLMIRFSGTEPLLRIYTETTSPERVQRLLQQGREIAGI
jgi:phosphomannomutase